ncbi:MAG TPA: hypothetical protein VKV77_00470 [Methylovirgula sp.]|nr:hypothetical protein [Methylovirgula sp.]
MKILVAVFSFFGVFLGLVVPMAFAQQQPVPVAAPKSSVAALLQQGYEVKDVTAVPRDEAKAAFQQTDSQAVITLQKGTKVAICTMALLNWALANPPSFNNATLCYLQE